MRQFGSWEEAIEMLTYLKNDFDFMENSYSKQGQESLGLVYKQKAYTVADCITVLKSALAESIKNFEDNTELEKELHEDGGKNNPY